MKDCNIPLGNITFIGHSLGAHVCGFAAKHIENLMGDKVGVIVAADPAAPCFKDNKCEERLCETDATHIICLHTSVLGFTIGHVTMQMNGGTKQPGCGEINYI